jgi:hypothetical protein
MIFCFCGGVLEWMAGTAIFGFIARWWHKRRCRRAALAEAKVHSCDHDAIHVKDPA